MVCASDVQSRHYWIGGSGLERWTYCLGKFARAPVQCWSYQINPWQHLNGGKGIFFPTQEFNVVVWHQVIRR